MMYNGIGNGMSGGIGGGFNNDLNGSIQKTEKQPAFLEPLKAVINPAWLFVGVLGLAVYAVYAVVKSGKKPEKKSPSNGSATVETTVDDDETDASDPYESMSDEEFQKEMIRQTMSELGKRSGTARARKKQTEKVHGEKHSI